MTRTVVLLAATLALSLAPAVQDATPAASRHDYAPPDGLAAPVASKLAKGGVRVALGGTALDFWWVDALPAESAPDSQPWSGVAEGTLLGALRVDGEFRDIRARILKPGVYTLRYGLQPENGDHLGVSPFREFLVVSPAGLDTDPAPRGHDGSIELSKEAIGGSHPAVLSIDPPVAMQETLQLHTTQLDHQAVVMEIPLQRDGKPAGALRFGVVLVGRIEA
ncbi:MAG TPA: hypothetical protein VD833_15280 [Vicinamibacterales bacterium]|nr:hypothetical protein [Vicinamibacterales bacterium]